MQSFVRGRTSTHDQSFRVVVVWLGIWGVVLGTIASI